MRKLLSVFLMLLAGSAYAQNARVQRFTAPLQGTVILKDAGDKFSAEVINMEMPEPDAEEEQKELREIKEEVERRYPRHTTASKSTHGGDDDDTAKAPIVVTGFIADSLPGVPPDNDMAISKGNKAVSVINSNIAVLDATTGKMLYRKGLKAYSSAVLNSINPNDYRYDPKVIYDPLADKFISIMLNGTKAFNYIVVGFSKTNDPAGAWNFYKFKGDYLNDTTWFDFPSISITKDEFFFTGNKIIYDSSWQAGFTQTLIYQVSKQSGYNGDTAIVYQVWDSIRYNGKGIRNLYPVKGGTELLGPEQYFLSNRNFDIQNDTIFLVKMPGTIASGNTNLTIQIIKTPMKYGVPPSGRQPDTSALLATNDGRILGAFAVDNEIQFVSASVDTSSGASAVYHGKIANFKNNPRIDHVHMVSYDTLDFGFPNIAYIGNGKRGPQALLSFNYTGPKTFPGLGAVLFDGEKYSKLVKVKTGDSSIKISWIPDKIQRWGDYLGAQPDYSSPNSVWIEGIFGRKDKNYGNWMAKLSSTLDQIPVTHEPLLYPNPSTSFLQFEFDLDGGYTVSFVIINYAGQKVAKILEQRCDAGRNRLQFDIAPLASGIYFLKAIDQTGKEIMTRRFIKQ